MSRTLTPTASHTAAPQVIEAFENEPNSLEFVVSIFEDISARAAKQLGAFSGYQIKDLPDMAAYGREVVHQLEGMPLAEKAITV